MIDIVIKGSFIHSMESISASDLVRNLSADSSQPEVEEALSRAKEILERVGIDPSSAKISIPDLKANLLAKIQSRERQLRSVRDVKVGSSEINDKRAAKRKKLQTEIQQYKEALGSLTTYDVSKV